MGATLAGSYGYPEADHRIGFGEDGRFAPGYLDTLSDWILER